MRILITGAAGMIGRKLGERLARDGTVGAVPIHQLVLADLVGPALDAPPGIEIETVSVDVSERGVADILAGSRPDLIFHLAAVVSGEAEADLEKGYRVNVDGTRHLLEAVRSIGGGYCPRVVFASSIAVFGSPFPEVIPDDFCTAPLTSYGTQKAIAELLLCDYSRRGFLDGVGVRLPTITVRPGPPNKAASGFFSGIIREPLAGRDAVLPVPDDIRHWHASPRAAIEFLLHAATLDTSLLGHRRCLTMPGVSVTVAEQIVALQRVAGKDAVRLIRHELDETVLAIVGGWPRAFDAERALSLGFRAESSFDEIVSVYVEDELGGRAAP